MLYKVIMKKIFHLAIALSVVLFVSSCENEKPQPKKPATLTDGQPKFTKEGELDFLKPDGTKLVHINIEIADDDSQRQQGLMNRSFMNNDQGMLFIFDKEERQAFWMRNTILPLDIIYVNAKNEIVSIVENAEPFSERSLPSKGPAIYVVEVNAGFCVQYGITAGYKIAFSRN